MKTFLCNLIFQLSNKKSVRHITYLQQAALRTGRKKIKIQDTAYLKKYDKSFKKPCHKATNKEDGNNMY